VPTPLELLNNPISQAVIAIFALMIAWEAFAPARKLPKARLWKTRGLISFGVYMLLSSYLPMLWGSTLASWQLFDLTGLGTVGGALAAFLVYELGAYAYHRGMHSSNFLWRFLHQMHHSAERVDTFGAFWFSPFDMIGWTALSSLVFIVIIGVTPNAATIAMLTITLLAVFQHANIRTPMWLGYIVQRPESHSRHHARGVHSDNYADLPVIDMLFGTFKNPPAFAEQQGFYDGASLRVGEMLIFKDVSEAKRERAAGTVAREEMLDDNAPTLRREPAALGTRL